MNATAQNPDSGTRTDDPAASIEQDFLLGTRLNEEGRYDTAIIYLRRAYDASYLPNVANNLALAFLNADRALEARMVLEDTLEKHPDQALPWLTYGAVLRALGQHRKAQRSFTRALELEPGFVAARQNLAATLHSTGDFTAALAEYETIFGQLPDDVTAQVGLCRALQGLDRHAEVIDRIENAFPADAAAPELKEVLALSLERTCQFERALDVADECLAAQISNPRLHVIRASSLSELDRHDEALRAVTAALSDVGADTKTLNVIGSLLESMNVDREAAEVYQTILQIEPMNEQATARLFDLRLAICDWQNYESLCADTVEHVNRDITIGQRLSIDVFNLQALPLDYGFVAKAARHHSAVVARDMRAIAPPFEHSPSAHRGEKRRIGYLLPYTWIHSLPLVLREIVRRHDRQRFDVTGYCTRPCNGSDFSRSYRAAFDRFVDVPGHAPYEAARIIHDDHLDVLIDVAGLTGLNCMDVLSFRPAPIQAHFLGYSITTGADFVDYLITDRTYIPPEWRQHNSEQLVYLPNTFMATVRQDISDRPVSRAEFGLPEDAVVFANFNHPCKFEPVIFDAWMQILRAVPGSVLWFGSWLNETAENLRREAEQRGVPGDRLIFSDIVEPDVHLARLTLADLALDNLYHGGGITTVDALWAGLPVLSIAGTAPGARLGATLLNAANVPDLVVPDLETYVRSAIDLARNPEKIQSLKSRLVAERYTCPLFDTERYCRNLENAYTAMRDHYRAGNPLAPIDLTDHG